MKNKIHQSRVERRHTQTRSCSTTAPRSAVDLLGTIDRATPSETREPRRRAVVVNDDLGQLEEISRFLMVHTTFDVAGVAMDGYEALETVGRLRPDLVVMDLRMPGMNGLDATEQLRRMFPSICIIMTSADDGPELAELCRDYGADCFVSKRRLHSDLPAAVQHAFGKH